MTTSRLSRLAALLAVAAVFAAAGPVHAQKKSGLPGTTWGGSETLPGYGALTFIFEDQGNVTMIDAKETVVGRYVRNGQNVTLSFFGGAAVYNGTIRGKTMSGRARNAQQTWSWKVTFERRD
jgi:hypothetical protein